MVKREKQHKCWPVELKIDQKPHHLQSRTEQSQWNQSDETLVSAHGTTEGGKRKDRAKWEYSSVVGSLPTMGEA